MTDKRLRRAIAALECVLPWVDRLIEIECAKRWRVQRGPDYTVMHSNGFREYCYPPRVEPLPWGPTK